MDIEWKEVTEPLKQLQGYHKNPRKLYKKDRDQIRRSLSKFGQCEDIVINTDYTIIGGHQRVKVLKEMGKSEALCKIPNRTLDDKEVEELCVRLNRNRGSFDYDILANAWDLNELLDWGFTPKEFDLGEEVETKPIKCKISIEVGNRDDLFVLESKVRAILIDYPEAKCKVKV